MCGLSWWRSGGRWRRRASSARAVDEFYRDPEPFGTGVRPDAKLLWDLSDLYERDRDRALAEWVCEFAIAFGMEGEGSDWDFGNRLTVLRESADLQGV